MLIKNKSYNQLIKHNDFYYSQTNMGFLGPKLILTLGSKKIPITNILAHIIYLYNII